MHLTHLLIVSALTLVAPVAHAFESFESETAAISDLIKCPAPNLTQDAGFPDLWGCIWPGAEVAKVFVSADGSGGVENVKVMWNDWTRDTGYGVHTDQAMAHAWLSAIATRYAPESVDKVLAAYAGNSDLTIQGPQHTLDYTYWKGPAIDERLVTITVK